MLTGVRWCGKDFLASLATWGARAAAELSRSPKAQGTYLSRNVTSARIEVAFSAAETRAAGRVFFRLGLGGVVSRLPSMLIYSWGTADQPDSPSTYAAWHRVAQAQYAVLSVLLIAGLFWTRRLWRGRFWRTSWPLLLLGIYETLVHLIFSVDERYTVPARPVLFLFSAAGARALVAWGGGLRARWKARTAIA